MRSSPTSFVIVADLRTGSTLLGASLDHHPDVSCYGELFHHDTFRDNRLEGRDRFRMSGREIVRFALHASSHQACGFRAMIFLPPASQPRWADAWSALGDEPDLKVLNLHRRDPVAQYASLRIAQQTGVYHAGPADRALGPEERPRVVIDPEDLRRFTEERKVLWIGARETLRGKPSLELQYEELTSHWSREVRRILSFLGVPWIPLPQAKSKQETRALSEVVPNYRELRARFGPAP